MDDLIRRLRNPAYSGLGDIAADQLEKQADEIAHLTKEVSILEADVSDQIRHNKRQAALLKQCREALERLTNSNQVTYADIELLFTIEDYEHETR